jgi:membrane-associated phospholipid phosphatase
VKTRTLLGFALSLVVLRPAISRGDELSVDVPTTAAVTGGAAVVFGVLELTGSSLTPASCRWCEPPALDRNLRLHLRWEDTHLAGTISDVLLVGTPLSLAAIHYFALTDRDAGRFGEDALVVLEALALTAVVTDAVKYTVARRRPAAWAAGVRTSAGDDNAFFSGHASGTFAAAAAFSTVSALRGYPGWPWMSAAGFASATAISYLRMAADRHWFTDVLTGAAVGTGIGVGVPLLFHRKAHVSVSPTTTMIITPVPLGVAGTF